MEKIYSSWMIFIRNDDVDKFDITIISFVSSRSYIYIIEILS